ncbi:MAG: hypothetical protein QGG63_00040 [Candidatus Pacebacteria bacterium]|jgi:hypothetical protein|nr:hypothetical protein [Candidatus Paceibacterota bacterium]|tara:strand:+ start:73958 stop:74464 length:507 start_codon:yes stop_codon:yes gene_type:complete
MEQAQDFLVSSYDTLGSVTSMSLDTIILITIFVAFFVYGLRYGKGRIISLILSFYISIPIIFSFPYIEKLSFAYSQIAVFLLIIVFLNIVISRFVYEEFPSRGLRRLIEAGLLSVSAGGLLLALSYHIIPITALHDFAAPIDALFTSTTTFFWWLIIPLAVLLFTVRR